jgi:hypothetical protein
MDYTTIDVGCIPGVAVGDRVTLIGEQGQESIGLEEVAEKAGTIPYEVACSVGKRVKRIYRGGDMLLSPAPTATSLPARSPIEKERSASGVFE